VLGKHTGEHRAMELENYVSEVRSMRLKRRQIKV
jgi:hypothetical protein